MHGSVLQNDKYIEFADENTVEVIELQRLQEGIDEKDRKAETYKAEDGREQAEEDHAYEGQAEAHPARGVFDLGGDFSLQVSHRALVIASSPRG